MLELIQFPWSPFCIVQRRILEYCGTPFKIVNIPPGDRSLVWRMTRQRYYGVPILKDGRKVLFESDETTQIIAKYIDYRLHLGLFPVELRGLQWILWRYIEHDVEEMTFKLNDIFWLENVAPQDQVAYVRHKERKFGRGCLEHWRNKQGDMIE